MKSKGSLTQKQSLALYRTMYLIRMSEEKIREYYPSDGMKTPAHLAIGSEAIAAGVCMAMDKKDTVFGTYRNHGLYLSKSGDTDAFFAELYGKKTGGAKGKAGSMHMAAPDYGLMGTSAVVGTTIPLAVGYAYAHVYKKTNSRVAAFFGDGAVDEGVFWESLNFACLKRLPVLFVCEDNELAIHSHKNERRGYANLSEIVKQFDCHVYQSRTTDVEEIFQLTTHAIDDQKKSGKPVFIQLYYYRYMEHVGVNTDFHFGYRNEKEFKKWYTRDPLKIQRKKLLNHGIRDSQMKKIEASIVKKIVKSIQMAEKAEFPNEEELYADVYA